LNLMVKCYLYGRTPKRAVVKLLRWLPLREYVPGGPVRLPLSEARDQFPGATWEWLSAAVDSPRGWGVGQDNQPLAPSWSLARGLLPLTGDVVVVCGPVLQWVEVQ
jgi:hypothetical protein